MKKINPNGTQKPITVGQGDRDNAPIVGRYKESRSIEGPKNTANMAAIKAEGQRNNKVKVGGSKSQTPFN